MKATHIQRNADSGEVTAQPLHLEARFMPSSINAENRTVDLVFATEKPFLRRSWDGPYLETLSFQPSSVRMERIQSGAPLCDNHKTYGKTTDSVLGVVERAWIEDGKGYATVRFSKRKEADDVFKDVQDGILKNISVGYRVYKYEISENETSADEYRAVDWEPFEVSIVPVPADYTAQIRSGDADDTNSVKIQIKGKEMLEENNEVPAVAPTEETRTSAPSVAPVTTADTTQPTPPEATTEQRSAADLTAERKRVKTVTGLVRAAGLGTEVLDGFVERGTSVEDAAEEITQKWAERSAPAISGTNPEAAVTGQAEAQTRSEAMEIAIAHRAGVQGVELREDAREFRSMSMVDIARTWLESTGENTRGMSQSMIARKAMNLHRRSSSFGYHSTSDFPQILGNTVNRSLRAAYEAQSRTFQAFTRRTTANDFRAMTKVQLSGLVGNFEHIPEGGEYKAGSFSEAGEAYAVKKYGKKVTITWETLINDDLDAFSRIPMAIAAEAAQLQSDLVYGILTGSPLMGDGVALFASDHGNLASSGAAISVSTLGTARAAMRKQTGLNGRYINVQPAYLIVGPDREVEAQQILNGNMLANTTGEVNPFYQSLQLVVDPRLGSAWFLSAAPGAVDTIEYAFLDGEGELFTETREDFDVDGTQVKARMVFGTKAIDWRGMYKNPGQ